MISVITPTWNSGKTIKNCLDSVAAQVGAKYEHVVVDGSSTDDTVSICRGYNVKLITNRPKGIYEKFNDGIINSSGEWIYCLCSDDVFIDHLRLNMFEYYAAKYPDHDVIYGDIFSQRLQRLVDGEFDHVKILTRNVPVLFYKRSLFDKIGLFNTKYKILADYDMSLRIWLSGHIKHKYVKLSTINYADGGISSIHRDYPFKADHFKNCVKYIVTGSLPANKKAELLLRLPLEILKKNISSRRFLSGEQRDRMLRVRYDRP